MMRRLSAYLLCLLVAYASGGWLPPVPIANAAGAAGAASFAAAFACPSGWSAVKNGTTWQCMIALRDTGVSTDPGNGSSVAGNSAVFLSIPSNWNNNDNAIEIVAGGGGGAVTGGSNHPGSGGGGAYSRLVNATLAGNGPIFAKAGFGGLGAVTGAKNNGASGGDGFVCSGPCAQVQISGTANNGSGLIRLAVLSTQQFATGDTAIVTGVNGTIESRGSWTITVIDSTHIDLTGSTFTNAFSSSGNIFGTITNLRNVLAFAQGGQGGVCNSSGCNTTAQTVAKGGQASIGLPAAASCTATITSSSRCSGGDSGTASGSPGGPTGAGGAAGPNGAGAAGGVPSGAGGAGGGASDGGSAAANPSTATGGAGGTSNSGTVGGAGGTSAGVAGAAGSPDSGNKGASGAGGGFGATAAGSAGGNGGTGNNWSIGGLTLGPGAGGGAGGQGTSAAAPNGGNGGLYGGGGGSAGYSSGSNTGNAGNGAQGIIVVRYTPIKAAYNTVLLTDASAGLHSWTVPAGITTLTKVEAIGAGGPGVSSTGGGGGAGAYAPETSITVTPGQTIYYHVGAGGGAYNLPLPWHTASPNGTNGEDTFLCLNNTACTTTGTNGCASPGGSLTATGGLCAPGGQVGPTSGGTCTNAAASLCGGWGGLVTAAICNGTTGCGSSLSAPTTASSTTATLTFAGGVPGGVAAGQTLYDQTTPGALRWGTMVQAKTATTVTIAPVPDATVGSGDTILFFTGPAYSGGQGGEPCGANGGGGAGAGGPNGVGSTANCLLADPADTFAGKGGGAAENVLTWPLGAGIANASGMNSASGIAGGAVAATTSVPGTAGKAGTGTGGGGGLASNLVAGTNGGAGGTGGSMSEPGATTGPGGGAGGAGSPCGSTASATPAKGGNGANGGLYGGGASGGGLDAPALTFTCATNPGPVEVSGNGAQGVIKITMAQP